MLSGKPGSIRLAARGAARYPNDRDATDDSGVSSDSAPCPTIRRRHGDGVPVWEPWMPPNGGTPWLQQIHRERRTRDGTMVAENERASLPLLPWIEFVSRMASN